MQILCKREDELRNKDHYTMWLTKAWEKVRETHCHSVCSDNLDHHKQAEVRLRVHWRLQYAAVHMKLVREWKWMERLLQHQRKQDTTVFLPARWRGAGGEGGDSRKVRIGEPASEGGEVTLSLKRHAIPEGGIRAHRHYAVLSIDENHLKPDLSNGC